MGSKKIAIIKGPDYRVLTWDINVSILDIAVSCDGDPRVLWTSKTYQPQGSLLGLKFLYTAIGGSTNHEVRLIRIRDVKGNTEFCVFSYRHNF